MHVHATDALLLTRTTVNHLSVRLRSLALNLSSHHPKQTLPAVYMLHWLSLFRVRVVLSFHSLRSTQSSSSSGKGGTGDAGMGMGSGSLPGFREHNITAPSWAGSSPDEVWQQPRLPDAPSPKVNVFFFYQC